MLIIPQTLVRGIVYFYLCYNFVSQACGDPFHVPSSISILQPSHLDQIHLIHFNARVHYPGTKMQVLKCNYAVEWYNIYSQSSRGALLVWRRGEGK